MYPYSIAGITLLIWLLAAGIVAVASSRRRTLSLKKVIGFVAALLLLFLASYLCLVGAFILAGGPDGKFLSPELLSFGALYTAAALAAVLFALRLLSVPIWWTAIFLAPAVLTLAGQAIEIWPLTLFAFGFCPFLCLAVIAALWVRGELIPHRLK